MLRHVYIPHRYISIYFSLEWQLMILTIHVHILSSTHRRTKYIPTIKYIVFISINIITFSTHGRCLLYYRHAYSVKKLTTLPRYI